jgi:hypothetical protein
MLVCSYASAAAHYSDYYGTEVQPPPPGTDVPLPYQQYYQPDAASYVPTTATYGQDAVTYGSTTTTYSRGPVTYGQRACRLHLKPCHIWSSASCCSV